MPSASASVVGCLDVSGLYSVFCKDTKSRKKTGTCFQFFEAHPIDYVKDNIKMRVIVRVCTQRLPNRLLSSVKKDSTTSRRSQIFMRVAALEYLGKVEDTDQRVQSEFIPILSR